MTLKYADRDHALDQIPIGRYPSTHAAISRLAMAIGCGALMPSGCVPASIAATSSRENQRQSSSSVVVAVDVGGERLGVAADHQRGGERPRLAGVIGDAADADAGFLVRLAPDRVLDRLAGLDEAGEAGVHARREMRLAAEQARARRRPWIASMITTGSVRGKCCALQCGQSRR